MSKLAEFRRAEQALKEQLALLEKLQADSGLKRDIEFEDRLKALMADYGVELSALVEILDPNYNSKDIETAVTPQRKPRQAKVYLNPFSGERLETKGGNHALLKAWKAEHGADVVEGWRLV